MPVLDTVQFFHQPLYDHYAEQEKRYYKQLRKGVPSVLDRWAAQIEGGGTGRKSGDFYLERVESLFHTGFGLEWTETQVKIFNAFVNACLPRIYGPDWADVQDRVKQERGLKKVSQEILVSLGRRNGKTWVTAATIAALALVVPGLSTAVFSVGERQAKMLMSTVVDRLEDAFNRGTHVHKEDYNFLERNKETLIFEHPDGGKQVIGCFPGSVR